MHIWLRWMAVSLNQKDEYPDELQLSKVEGCYLLNGLWCPFIVISETLSTPGMEMLSIL